MTALAEPQAPLAPAAQASTLAPVKYRGPLVVLVLSVVLLVVFALAIDPADTTTFRVATSRDVWQISPFTVPSLLTCVLASLVAIAIGVLALLRARARRDVPAWWYAIAGVVLLFAVLAWSVAGTGNAFPLTLLLVNAVGLAVPLCLGALAGLLCERSGVINIAIEGQLLAGAFLAVVVGTVSGNPYVGLVAAPVAGALVGAVLALFAVRYWVDQIIVGVVLNVLVIGLTNYLFSTVLTNDPQGLNAPPRLPELPIPGLSAIPILGPALFNHPLTVYLMYAAVIVLQVMVFRSRWGLRLRSVGEHPKAADTVGIKVNPTRVRSTILGSALAGFGGAALVSAGLAFTKELTSGKGYIALAAMILGRWSPTGAFAAALFFGTADALRRVLNNLGSPIPSELLGMLPYLATIFAVAGLVGRVRPPAAEGIPYKK